MDHIKTTALILDMSAFERMNSGSPTSLMTWPSLVNKSPANRTETRRALPPRVRSRGNARVPQNDARSFEPYTYRRGDGGLHSTRLSSFSRQSMDGSQPGQAGVLAWCNSIRTSIAKDPGREFLDAQIQKQGFDFLESYREGIFSRQKEACVFSFLTYA